MSLTVGSLFSGIGGLDLGLERAGMEIKWQVENDDFCRRVLAKHWPNVPCYGDIREVRGAELEPVDLICGGFPCQPTSHAGRRRGEDDDRWLWPEMLRLIRETRPAYVVGENVFGLVTHNEGLLLASVISDLEAEGYEVAAPVVFPACAIGALHRRDRVWVCAYARHNDRGTQQGQQQEERAKVPAGVDAPRTYADDTGLEGRLRAGGEERPSQQLARTMGALPHTKGEREWAGLCETQSEREWWRRPGDGAWWSAEPAVGRVAHGVPSRVDRLKSLGNAVVPQAAELIGRHIMRVAS